LLAIALVFSLMVDHRSKLLMDHRSKERSDQLKIELLNVISEVSEKVDVVHRAVLLPWQFKVSEHDKKLIETSSLSKRPAPRKAAPRKRNRKGKS